MDSLFPCTSCGICCRNIGDVEQLRSYHQGDGICIYLKDDLCTIYHERPDICRVDRMYEKEYKDYFTREQFYEENIKICRELQLTYGVPVEKQVK